MLLIHLVFLLHKIALFPCHSVVDMCSCILPQLADRFFLFFWNVLFCLYCFIFLDVFLVFLLLSVPSDLYPRVLFFVLQVVLLFFFSSQDISAFFL